MKRLVFRKFKSIKAFHLDKVPRPEIPVALHQVKAARQTRSPVVQGVK